MKRMPNINLTEQELNRLFLYPYAIAGESVICIGDRTDTLYKIFFDRQKEDAFDVNQRPRIEAVTNMPENKEKKVVRLYEMGLEHSVQPISTITSGDRLIGYEISRDIADVRFQASAHMREDVIAFLKQSKEILEYYASKDITHGDVKQSNILISARDHSVKFCDIDNMRVGEYPIDLEVPELSDYLRGRECDESADAYMHNLMTLQTLSYGNDYYCEILERIKDGEMPKRYKLGARRIIKSMSQPETFTGEYIAQYIKK